MILVTGGAGFIGSNVVAALCERGFDVVVCDRLGSNDKWRNVARHAVFDIVLPERLFDWLATAPQLDAVIHMGAISATTAMDADLVYDVNVTLQHAAVGLVCSLLGPLDLRLLGRDLWRRLGRL